MCERRNLFAHTFTNDGLSSLIKGSVMYTFAGTRGCLYAEAEDISHLERSDCFESTSEHWTSAALRTVIKHLQSLMKPKACVFSRTAGKTEQHLFARLDLTYKLNNAPEKYTQK